MARRALGAGWTAVCATLLGAALGAAPASAQVVVSKPSKDPVVRCFADQTKAQAGLCKASLSCYSKYAKAPDKDPDQSALAACLAKGDAKFLTSYQKGLDRAAAAPATCKLADAPATVLGDTSLEIDAIYTGILAGADLANPVDARLRSRLLKAAGRQCSSAFKAEAKDAKKRDEARRASNRLKAHMRFDSTALKSVIKASGDGVTYDGTDPDQVADDVDAIVDGWVAVAKPLRFAIAGLVVTSEATFVDSDVNDPETTRRSNDIMSSAQEILVPSTVGGHVNLPNAGAADGQTTYNGDEVDIYKGSFTGGETIVLSMGDDPLVVDLDLCLFIEDPINPGQPLYIDCSLGVDSTESVAVPGAGEYFVEVFPWAGCACSSNYVLNVGQTGAAMARNTMRLSDDFVPGEAVVKVKKLGGVPAMRSMGEADGLARSVAMRARRGAPDREMLFSLDAKAKPPSRFSAGDVRTGDADDGRWRPRLSEDLKRRADTIDAIKRLRRREDVATADLNRILQPTAVTPNDPLYPRQWHYPLINLPEAWEITTGSNDVIVAVIDTGVALDHPDLQSQVIAGYDFVSSPFIANDGDGIDSNPDDPGDLAFFGRSSFHGTHVAGTVAAATFNGQGVAGVAWNTRVMPVRVLGVGGGMEYDVLQGVRYAARLSNDSGGLPAKRADIINLSLGGGGFSQTSQDLFTQVAGLGVITIAAAGNGATSEPLYPAGYDDVVSVSSVDPTKALATYSNFGSTIDVAAPGGDAFVDLNGDGIGDGVLSTLSDDSQTPRTHIYEIYEGTSMAAPHVAGVVALMKSIAPAMTPAELDILLNTGTITEDLGAAGRDDSFGWGLIDAYQAVVAATDLAGGVLPPPVPVLVPGPVALNFGVSRDTLTLSLSNGTSGALTVNDLSADANWVTITPMMVDGEGLGSYDITVNRGALNDGTHRATLTATSTANTVEVAILVSKGIAFESDGGFQYILLIDPDTQVVLARFTRRASKGTYPFEFPSVPPGEYHLVTGSDQDADGFICDGGESCGGFPLLSQLERIVLQDDMVDLEINLSFHAPLQSTIATPGAEQTAPALPGPFPTTSP